jgi:hypothetical protein
VASVELALGRVDDASGQWTHVPSGLIAARVLSRDGRPMASERARPTPIHASWLNQIEIYGCPPWCLAVRC